MKPDPGVTDPLMDDALRAEIERALAVDPSPEFTARVRARVAEMPAPGWGVWRLRWAVAPVAVAAAVGAIAMVLLDTPHPGDEGHSPATAAAGTTVARSPLPSNRPSAIESVAPAPAARPLDASTGNGSADRQRAAARAVTTPASNAMPLPEVLVPPEEIAAWQNYLAMFSQGDIDRPLPKLLRERDETPEPSDIVIPPLALSIEDPIEGEVE